MRLDPERALGKAAVAIVAVLPVMAAVAGLRVVQGLYRMDADKITPVAFGFIVAPEITSGRIGAVPAALMAIQTPGLLVALTAVIACLARQNAMSAYEVCVMVG